MARISAPHISDSAVSFELTLLTVEEFRERIESTLARYPWLACTSAWGSSTSRSTTT